MSRQMRNLRRKLEIMKKQTKTNGKFSNINILSVVKKSLGVLKNRYKMTGEKQYLKEKE